MASRKKSQRFWRIGFIIKFLYFSFYFGILAWVEKSFVIDKKTNTENDNADNQNGNRSLQIELNGENWLDFQF